MRNSKTEQMFLIPARKTPIYHTINVHKERNRFSCIYMTFLTEEEENDLDNFKDDCFKLVRGDRTFQISKRQIYCCGEIDFNSKEDCEQIDKFDFLNYLEAVGVRVFSNYDYNLHAYHSPNRFPLWTETWSPLYLCKIAHGALDKPKRIILFKQVYDTLQKKRSR